MTKATRFAATPKSSASRGWTRMAATGRLLVLRMRASMSLSRKWLRAFAPPDASAPATSTTTASIASGGPPEARNMPAKAVNRSSRTIRGLVRVM